MLHFSFSVGYLANHWVNRKEIHFRSHWGHYEYQCKKATTEKDPDCLFNCLLYFKSKFHSPTKLSGDEQTALLTNISLSSLSMAQVIYCFEKCMDLRNLFCYGSRSNPKVPHNIESEIVFSLSATLRLDRLNDCFCLSRILKWSGLIFLLEV